MTSDGYDDDLLAAVYDDDNPAGKDHEFFRLLADEVGATQITDLGCGTGTLTVALAAPGRRVIGIDPAAAMLARARSRPHGDTVEWRLGTAEQIDQGENDLIVMSGNVAMHLLGDDWHSALRAMARGLSAGGSVAFETRNPRARSWEGWSSPATERHTSAGRLLESTTVSPPDDDGVVVMRCHNALLDAGRRIDVVLRLQFRTAEQVAQDLRAAGLTVLNTWRSWDREPFTGSAAEPLMIFHAASVAD